MSPGRRHARARAPPPGRAAQRRRARRLAARRRPPTSTRQRALVEALLDAAGVPLRVEPAREPFLHPGRAASVVAEDGREIGWVGEVHPAVSAEWDIESAAAFELDADALAELWPGPAAYRDVTSFPAVLQDIAVVVPDDVPAAEVEAAVRAGGGELLGLGAAVRRLPRRAGGRGQQVAGAAAGVPRARPHAHRRGRRRPAGGNRGAPGRDRGAAPCIGSRWPGRPDSRARWRPISWSATRRSS